MSATVVEVGKLLGVVGYSLLATVGVITLFSLAVLGLSRVLERRQAAAGGALGYAALAFASLAGCIVAVIYGVVLLAHK